MRSPQVGQHRGRLRGPALGRWCLAGIWWALFLVGCGYRSLVGGAALRVDTVQLAVPQPSLAVCLTRELRLSAASSSGGAAEPYRLVGELVAADHQPGAIVWRDGYRPLDQEVELALRVRLFTPAGELVWGPSMYRLSRRVPAPSANASVPATAGLAAAQEGARWVCQAVARQVIDEVKLFLAQRPAQGVAD